MGGGAGGSGIVVIRYANSVSVNSINLSTFNAIIANYINYIITRQPSPLYSVTIPPGTTWLTIPIDIVNNDSVEINLKFGLTGTYNGDEVFIKYKTLGQDYVFNLNLSSHTRPDSVWVYLSDGRITTIPSTENLTSVFTINIYRAISTPFTRYIMSGNGVYDVYQKGTTRVEFSGMINERIPDAIFLTWGPNYGMNAQYTITNTPG